MYIQLSASISFILNSRASFQLNPAADKLLFNAFLQLNSSLHIVSFLTLTICLGPCRHEGFHGNLLFTSKIATFFRAIFDCYSLGKAGGKFTPVNTTSLTNRYICRTYNVCVVFPKLCVVSVTMGGRGVFPKKMLCPRIVDFKVM